MSFVFGSNSASTGYNLTRSLRFRASASAYLNRTPASATNRQTWTYSAWVKLTAYNPVVVGNDSYLLTTKFDGVAPYATTISINSSYKLVFASYDGSGGSPSLNLVTTQVFRDYSAWYHIVVVADTTQATAANRAKMYVNGVQITSFSTATYPSQNYNTYVNKNDVTVIGALYYSGGGPYGYYNPLDGYTAETNFIDGQVLTPSSFGSTNALTGVWQPAAYTGTYGTNGFYLPFTDNSALTTSSNVGLGKDFSGNGNYWATNNISITAGVTYDSMTDVPTLTSATAANFAVLNPLSTTAGTYSNANLQYYGASAWRRTNGTIAVNSNKWYWEVTIGNAPYTPRTGGTSYNCFGFGLSTVFNSVQSSATVTDAIILGDNAYYKNFSGSWTDSGLTFVSGDVLSVAVDLTANTFTFYRNNSSVVTGTIGVTAGTTLTPIVLSYDNSYGLMNANFGQRPFTYTPPTGFVALNTYNLPTSTIVKGNTVFDATLYTGTGATLNVVNAAPFKPDLVWLKARSATYFNALFDSVRGANKVLVSNSTDQERTETAGSLSSFDSSGFTLASGAATYAAVNNSGTTYVGWQWQAGQGTTSSNTNGTITSTVSVNASAGFSVVTYTGTGANATVGHGLGVAPQLVITKCRGAGTTSWAVWHINLTSATYYLLLDSTAAQAASSTVWNSTAPTSSVFSVGTSTASNFSTMVAYCWTPIAGFSAFGSYAGNGSTDGPFVYTGFRPKFVLIKRTDGVGNWSIYDTARDTYNVMTQVLYPNLSDAEANNTATVDYLSNGFKLRIATYQPNTSGATFVYAAFAENPFKNSLAR